MGTAHHAEAAEDQNHGLVVGRNGVAHAPGRGGWRHDDPAQAIPEAELTFGERRVLEVLREVGGEPLHLQRIITLGFPGYRPRSRAYNKVRNSLRRLVVGGYAARVDAGTYIATR